MRIKKLMLLSLVTCSLLNGSSQLVNETFVGREWEFMQYKFQHRPTLKGTCKLISGITVTTVLGSLAGYLLSQNSKEPMVFASISGAFSFFISSIVGMEFIMNSNRFNKGIKFIKHWPKNKPYTPTNLHTTFDELYNLYLDQGISERFVQEYKKVFRVIKQALYHRFPPLEHQVVRSRTDLVCNPTIPFTMRVHPTFLLFDKMETA